MDTILDFIFDHPDLCYQTIFGVLLACGMGVPVPEDLVLIVGGYCAYLGVCNIWVMLAVSLAGVLIGDSTMFFLGHKFGPKLLKRKPFCYVVDETKIEKIKDRLHRHGGKVLFSARFMPGLRSTIFFASGSLHFPYRKLMIYDGGAALISVPAIVYSVYYFGDFLDSIIRRIKRVEGGMITVIFLVATYFVVRYLMKKQKSKRGEIDEL